MLTTLKEVLRKKKQLYFVFIALVKVINRMPKDMIK